MRRSTPIVGLILIAGSSMAFGAEDAKAPLISAKFVEKRGLKPPLRCFYVRLTVTNPREHATWYVTRYRGDRPLAANTPFKAISPWKRGYEIHNAYNGDRFGGKGKFRTTRFIGADPPGEDQHSFVAFLLPPGGTLTHDYFPVRTWSDITSLEIWEVSQLLVNGKTPLQDWLPYEVASSAETHITQKAQWESLRNGAFQWKEGKRSSDYPKEEVKSIVPTVLTKNTVPIEGLPWKRSRGAFIGPHGNSKAIPHNRS